MKLSDLKPKQKAKIVSIKLPKGKNNEENKKLRRHFLEMGLTKGTEIELISKAPMGDPITIKVRGYQLSIGNSNLIEVEPIQREKGGYER